MKHFLAIALAALTLPCAAQDARPIPSGEPAVRHTVIEDQGARIDELRVRGQLQRIVVTSKVGGRSSYEIITGDCSRDLSAGAQATRGAVGKSAWNVLSF